MFVAPSKIKRNKILKGRTLSFETPSKTHGNMVIIPTRNKESMTNTIKSNLFRPMQLLALYSPRKVKPIGRQATIINQKDYYADIRTETDGRIRKGKTILSAYNGQNIVYDLYNEFVVNTDFYKTKYKRLVLQNKIYEFFENKVAEIANNSDYTDIFLVFPMDHPIEDPQRVFVAGTEYESTDPLVLFLQAIIKETIDLKKYSKVKLVVFYIPKDDIMVAVDLHDPDLKKNWPSIAQKLKRLNAHNMGEDDLADELEDEQQAEPETLEDKKENLKSIVLNKVAKTIHANLTDFEVATRDERDLMTAIDNKIEKYISNPENLKKTVDDMITDLERDNEVKTKAVRYVEAKKAANTRSMSFAKQLDKEAELIGSLQDLDDDSSENTPDTFISPNQKYDDIRVSKSRLSSFDDEYNKKQIMKDLTNVVSAFSDNEYLPMAVDSISIEDSSTDADEKRTMKVRYKTDDGNQASFQIDIPKIVDKRFFYLGGNKKIIKKQIKRLPIVKTKSDRVEITTNFQKMTIERTSGNLSRRNLYILKKLKETGENPNVKIEYGDNSIVNGKMGYSNDFEYEELASYINRIDTLEFSLYFNRDIMQEEMGLQDIPDSVINDMLITPLGFRRKADEPKGLIYIKDKKIYEYVFDGKEAKEIKDSLFNFLADDVLYLDMSHLPTIGKSFMYTTVKFLQTKYPLFSVVASQVGLTNIMDRYNVEYHFNKKQERRNPDYVEVRFKDRYLYYKDELKNTLLLNPLILMETTEYDYSDFDADIPYTHYFMRLLGDSVGIHTRNTIRINLQVMVDPITKDVLHDLKQPTDIIDMMLYANTLLVGNQYKPQNDITNYRIISNELVADMLYGEIANAYVSYAKHKLNGNPTNLVLPKGILISKLLQETNVNDKSTLNPVIEAEQIAQASAKGYRGVNLNSAFTLEMRSYDDSMVGFLSGTATPYSGQAGITRSLSYDPVIDTVRGYIPKVDIESLSAANILSPTELLSPFTSASADAPRQSMQVSQTSATLPVESTSRQLIGSGVNKTLAYMISNTFCFKAAKDGFVYKIDKENKIVILHYDDGTTDAVDIGTQLDKNSGMGFYIHQLFKLVYKEGERFKAGDVIAYNPSYFSGKGNDVDYCPGTLAKIAIAPGDFSFEDSTLISETLSEKCASRINMLTAVSLSKNATIYKTMEEGSKVKTGDVLLEFIDSVNDEDTAELLNTLSNKMSAEDLEEITRDTIKSKFTGTITSVKMYYNCPFEELSPSLQSLLKKYKTSLEKRASALKDISHDYVHVQPLRQTNAKKIGKKEFADQGGVIIEYYVEYIDKMGCGDKLSYSTALKGVISKVVDKDAAPIADYRPDEPIEAILTPTGVISRMTLDIYLMTFGNKCLVELGKQIREIWNK